MNRKNKIKAIVALAVALAFVMPGAAAFANVGTFGITSNSENTDDIENIVEISTNSDTSDTTLALPVHNLDTGLDYATIQEAIDAVQTLDGHTIYVDNGTYYEYLTVDKSINLVGQSKEGTIMDGSGGTEKILLVIVDNVNVSSFTFRNGNYGPYFNPSNYSSITNCIGNNIKYGFYSTMHVLILLVPAILTHGITVIHLAGTIIVSIAVWTIIMAQVRIYQVAME